ncbi:DNA mismatch repair protein MSH6 isoform X2 [Cynara cardunculus var. scolymus]|uniref:DNA mismatch repair protein MSH6 isoform X2 n=1 Tax=Cynara cardunculus var. scolymus TaxID=59895 RepID=UPI000D626F71|nr:DNA mismatch repair protein MSH6 isoform X2 [Cynara cardunculus var. scolymus]
MAFRRPSNGRSPLVNPQRQITSFFSKSPSSTSSTSPLLSNSKPKPKPKPTPTTPSPPLTKRTNNPPLLLTPNPIHGHELVDRRIRVYWPLDKTWYEGRVTSFHKTSGKHLVQYDDAEEELLDLSKEKIELLNDHPKRFRRLRRFSIQDQDDDAGGPGQGNVDKNAESGGDDSADEDWGIHVEKEVIGDETDDLDLVDEDEENTVAVKPDLKKRKSSGMKLDSAKKIKTESFMDLSRASLEPINNINNNFASGKTSAFVDNVLVGDKAERFTTREEEKFKFIGKDRRDAKKRSPGDENYDPRTLYLPPHFLKSLTGGQRQWWEFKSKHMDKVLFFKMGKFYELFEMDAHVGAKELDLQYMKGDQPHCGFPEKNFALNVGKLACKGYRVLVVEQTETPDQLERRNKEHGSKDKVVKREICAVITKGTLTDGEMLSANPDASYLFAVSECYQPSGKQHDDRVYGVCVVDVATGKIIIGQFEDDLECSVLSCLLSQLRPVEIIKPIKLLSPETERVLLRQTRSPVVNELVPLEEFWDAEKTICEIKEIYQRISNQSVKLSLNESIPCASKDCLPEGLSELMAAGKIGCYALSALGGILFYLKKAFLDEALLRFAKFELLPCSGSSEFTTKPYMILDAAALENLEVFENSGSGDAKGTLYDQLNRCVTAFGKRLLKAWLARPLYHIDSIWERQEAVAGVKGVNLPHALEFRKQLSMLPDMERLLAHIFSCSEANGRNSSKVVLYEDAAKKQLQEFIMVLSGCELIINACSSLGVIMENSDSRLLHHLLTPGKGLPDVYAVLRHFKDAFDWMEAKNSGRIIPRDGVDKEYDTACSMVTDIEWSLTKHLKEQRKLLGDPSINYVTVGKVSYLLEVPESLCGNVPCDYELQSSKKGFSRYWTPAIKNYIKKLSEAESEKESKFKSIMQRLIGRFCEHHVSWRQLISTAAELDVLISIAIASDLYEGPTCRPLIVDPSIEDEAPFLAAKNLGHPVLRNDSLGDATFVSNDVCIGGSNHARFILLTGPNMGGKSTLLRQVCLAVILAQVGADVPAERFKMSPVDRIFVRMGAKDHIMAGQSTFLTELLETASMLSSATHNSLVALDELGRGTATSDGQAIAASVLEHLVNKVQCRGLFSTHYHHLALDYQRIPKVSLCHMACQVGNGVGGLEEVTFLYKLTLGACPKSYGVNVARLAGLPDGVLQKAATKSEEFEAMYGKKRKQSKGWEKEVVVIMQSLWNCHCGSSADAIFELQNRAKILLEQK